MTSGRRLRLMHPNKRAAHSRRFTGGLPEARGGRIPQMRDARRFGLTQPPIRTRFGGQKHEDQRVTYAYCMCCTSFGAFGVCGLRGMGNATGNCRLHERSRTLPILRYRQSGAKRLPHCIPDCRGAAISDQKLVQTLQLIRARLGNPYAGNALILGSARPTKCRVSAR